jgi:hypothetical protein
VVRPALGTKMRELSVRTYQERERGKERKYSTSTVQITKSCCKCMARGGKPATETGEHELACKSFDSEQILHAAARDGKPHQ